MVCLFRATQINADNEWQTQWECFYWHTPVQSWLTDYIVLIGKWMEPIMDTLAGTFAAAAAAAESE